MVDKFTSAQHLSMALGAMDPDVSPDFSYNVVDARIGAMLVRLEKTAQAFEYFQAYSSQLTDYAYWFYLGTLWVSYNGWSDLDDWRQAFLSGRRHRKTSLMKPSEVVAFDQLPKHIHAYRAHRPGETDWMSYTLDIDTAKRFAQERGVSEIAEYRLNKRDVLALFLRRGEYELLSLWPKTAKMVGKLAAISM